MNPKPIKLIDGSIIYFDPNGMNQVPKPTNESVNNNKSILTEYQKFIPIGLIKEDLDNLNKRLVVSGIFQRVGEKNQNGRIYTADVLAPQVEKYKNEVIAENRAIGELDHPESSVVSLSNASHNILNLEWKGNDLIGTFEVLNTPKGQILRELLKSGITIGVSSRGLGTTKKVNESEYVQPDFELLTFDIVSNPSVRGGFVESVNENKLNESIQQEAKPIISFEDAYKLYQNEYDYLLKKTFMAEKEIRSQFR